MLVALALVGCPLVRADAVQASEGNQAVTVIRLDYAAQFGGRGSFSIDVSSQGKAGLARDWTPSPHKAGTWVARVSTDEFQKLTLLLNSSKFYAPARKEKFAVFDDTGYGISACTQTSVRTVWSSVITNNRRDLEPLQSEMLRLKRQISWFKVNDKTTLPRPTPTKG